MQGRKAADVSFEAPAGERENSDALRAQLAEQIKGDGKAGRYGGGLGQGGGLRCQDPCPRLL